MGKHTMKTKRAYKRYLDSFAPEHDSPNWVIGGARRTYYMNRKMYGAAMQKHDPIAFEIGFNEWKLKK